MSGPFLIGAPCTLNNSGDLLMEAEAWAFVGKPCVVVKVTKGGLVQVALRDNPKRVYSAPQRNVDLL